MSFNSIHRMGVGTFHDPDLMRRDMSPLEKNTYSFSFNMKTLVDRYMKPHLRFNNLDGSGSFASVLARNWFNQLRKEHIMYIQQQFKKQILKDFETVAHKQSDAVGTTTYEIDYSKCFELRIATRDRFMNAEITEDYNDHPIRRVSLHPSVYGEPNHIDDYSNLRSYELRFEIEINNRLEGIRKHMANSYLKAKFNMAKFETFARNIKDKMFDGLTEQDIPINLGIGNSADATATNHWLMDNRCKDIYFPTQAELENNSVEWKDGIFAERKSHHGSGFSINDILDDMDGDSERLLDAVEWLNQNGVLMIAESSGDNRGIPLRERVLTVKKDCSDNQDIAGEASSFVYFQLPAALEPEPDPEPTTTYESGELFVFKPQNPIISDVERRRLDNEQARELIKQRTQERIDATLKKMKKSLAKP